jgi:hypothetical protein
MAFPVRDQGVGGSNPLSPTIIFNSLQVIDLDHLVAGIVFAVVLIMVQLGFQAALYQSATLRYDYMTAGIVLLSPQYEAIMCWRSWTAMAAFSAPARAPGILWPSSLTASAGALCSR